MSNTQNPGTLREDKELGEPVAKRGFRCDPATQPLRLVPITYLLSASSMPRWGSTMPARIAGMHELADTLPSAPAAYGGSIIGIPLSNA